VSDGALFLAVFLACLVEAVEATTIVLAAGVSRSWRSALIGVAAAIGVLGVVVAVLGPSVSALPISTLRLVIGALLLVFGLQWLRKGVLRAAGYQALHDEEAIYRREVAEAKGHETQRRSVVDDWYAFTLAFKGVLLEGLEVVFIVLTFGANQGSIGLASLAAAAAVVVVVVLAVAVRAPLAKVPENSLKLAVGVMLTSFGSYWGAEGAGAHWPAGDAAIVVLVACWAVSTVLTIASLRRRHGLVPVG
jgi:uncharacterized membrane protein